MFAVVPCVVALLAPLEAARNQRAAAAPGGIVIPSVVVVPAAPVPAGATPPATTPHHYSALGRGKPPEITVPDEGRANLMPAADPGLPSWKRPPAPAAPPAPTPNAVVPAGFSTPAAPAAPAPPAEDLGVTVRKNVLAGKLTREVAVRMLVQSAEEDDRAGHRDLALRDAEMALERDPADRAALRLRAGYRFDAGDFAGALRDSDDILARHPGDAATRFARAVVLQHGGRHAEAHRALTDLIRADPAAADYYHARAEAAFRLERYQDADIDSEIAVELAPAEPRYRLLRMKMCVAFGRYEDVYGHFLAGYQENRHRVDCPVRRQALVELLELSAFGFRQQMTSAAAIESYGWMVQACPDYARPRVALANEYLLAGNPAMAEACADEAVRRDPVAARTFHVRGQARAALGRPDALADFEAALCLDGTARDTRAELIARYRAAGRTAEARELAEAGVELHPDAPGFRQHLADDALRTGDLAAAERHATYALWLAKEPADAAAARLTRALARLAHGDVSGAAGDLQEARSCAGEPGA